MAQLVFVGVGIFFAAGTAGPAAAMVANLTHISIHATAFAVLSLANNLLGMAHGPMIAGAISDRWGLLAAFQWLPVTCLAAALAFAIGKRYYASDVARLEAQAGAAA
jgi:MFS family permease